MQQVYQKQNSNFRGIPKFKVFFLAPKFVEVFKILSYFPKNKIFTSQAYDVFIITLASEITKI